jgi:hypothetical protein
MVASSIAKRAIKNRAKKKLKKDPKPKFKAKRKVSSEVESKLKKQESVKRNAPASKSDGGPSFKQTQRERAADKAKKSSDTRAKSAGSNLTAAQRKRINDAPTPQALTSLQSTMVKEIDGLKSLSDAQKSTRKKSLRSTISDQKDTLRKRAETPAKKSGPTDPAKKRQSADERARAGFGNVRAIGTTQRNKKEGLGMMSSYTSMQRADAIVKARKDLSAGKITQAEYDRIMAAIDKKDAAASQKAKLKASAGRSKPVKPLPNPFANMKRGGMVKSVHTDMRKGGMFYNK